MIQLLTLILILLPAGLKGSDDLFNHACDAFATSDYSKAYDVFESIKDKTSDVWYNMGNAAYKQDKLVPALVCWERAAKYASGQLCTDSRYNLEQVRSKLGITRDKQSLFEQLIGLLSTGAWQLIFLCVWYAAVLSMLYANRKRLQVLLLVMSSVGGVMLMTATQLKKRSVALVVKEDGTLFAGPDDKFHVIHKLSPLAYLVVEDTKESWYKVRYNHTIGWVPMEAIEVI